MASFTLLGVCVISLTQAAVGFHPSSDSVIIALPGDDVILPCDLPSIKSCLLINWNMAGRFGLVTEVVRAGVMVDPNIQRRSLQRDCSLRIHHLVNDDARLYTCESGIFNSNVSIKILKLTKSPFSMDGTVELQCFLDTYKGYTSCTDRDIGIKWSAEDDSPISGERFHINKPSHCFSKLTIRTKRTDHHRMWKCHLTQNEEVKATVSYLTTLKDGIEEVFAALGESPALSCRNPSSSDHGVQWLVNGRSLTDDTFRVNKDSSLVMSKVRASNSNNYQCLQSSGEKRVLNNIYLHILDVTSTYGPGGVNLTLTCVLTCAQVCEKDFNLTWRGDTEPDWQGDFTNSSNTLTTKLFIPVPPVRPELIICSVMREGSVMVSKAWRSGNSTEALAWLALPICLLTSAAAIILYMYMRKEKKKRKHSMNTGTEPSRTELTHIHEVIEDGENDELRSPRQEGAPPVSFYDLLQAVN